MPRKTLHLLLIGLLAGLVISGCVVKDDPCDGITCDGHGDCIEWEGDAMCECDTGYKTSDDLIHCEPAGYTISLTWSFSDAADCMGAQVASVDVTMLEGGTEVASENIACSAGGADIEETQNGSYTIELRANSNSDELTYYGEGAVTVADGDESLNIEMDPIGFAAFTWDFDGMDCATSGVGRVRVKINEQATPTNNLYTANPVPDCDEGGHSTEDTAFLYSGTGIQYNLVLEGVCDSNLEVGYSLDVDMDFTEKGENNYGLLTLDPVGGGCP